MSKIGVSLKLDVSKIQKDMMFKGKKGTYLDAVVFIDLDNKDQHGNNGMIVQDWKDAPKGQTPILGNAKVFWSDGGQGNQRTSNGYQNGQQGGQSKQQSEPDFPYDDSIPF